MLTAIKYYLKANLMKGLETSPFRAPLKTWLLVPPFVALALLLGFGAGLLRFDPIMFAWAPLLILGMLISPSLIEEILFRGLMVPRQILRRGRLWAALAIVWSTIPYVLWHPLSALTTRPEARDIFLNPVFLTIVTLLGVSCGHSYIVSRSLWSPILIHWLTVVVWVFLLGGHELVLGPD